MAKKVYHVDKNGQKVYGLSQWAIRRNSCSP